MVHAHLGGNALYIKAQLIVTHVIVYGGIERSTLRKLNHYLTKNGNPSFISEVGVY